GSTPAASTITSVVGRQTSDFSFARKPDSNSGDLYLRNVPSGSREEIVFRANNVIAKKTGVGKLRM
ncbi:MAG: hypothetical protein WBQ64_02375, partial [Terriglobales bacterium]